MNKPKIPLVVYKMPPVSPVDHDKLNSFSEHTAIGLKTLEAAVAKIIDIINSAGALPDGSVSAEDNALDGSNVFVDVNAQSGDVFFDDSLPDGDGGTGRPVTVKEALYAIYKVSAAATKHVREGASIGDAGNPTTISNNGSISVAWPFDDRMFVPYLFFVNSGTVTPATGLNYSLNTTTNTLTITNNSGGSVNVFGVIWHPAFAM